MSGGPTHMGPLPVGPRLTRRGAQQQGQQCQAEALHGRRQHALREPERGAGAADRSPLGGRPGREKPQSEDPTPRTLPFSDPGNDHSPGITGKGGKSFQEPEMPHPQPISQSIHHHRFPAREEKSALSSEVAARGPHNLRPAPA